MRLLRHKRRGEVTDTQEEEVRLLRHKKRGEVTETQEKR